VALSSKQYFLDFFEDAHVPMPDISGYIRERVKCTSVLFYVPNPCILGTRPVLPRKNGSSCKLELVRTKSVFVLPYSCYLSAVGCS